MYNTTKHSRVYTKGETIFHGLTPKIVKCPICCQNCPKPKEENGPTSWAAEMAKMNSKHWISICKFLDMSEHQDAHIIWKRIGTKSEWTNMEIEKFESQLKDLRNKIGSS